jgi:hypothetical protein
MEISIPLLVAIASGLFALFGALGSQVISAVTNLKAKRMELAYVRKADTYRDFMMKAGTFGHDPWNEEKYVQYLHAYLAAQIIASDSVYKALTAHGGVNSSAQQLRTERNYDAMFKVQGGSWRVAMENVTQAMREDLQSLSKH